MNWGINKVTDVRKISSKVLEAELHVKAGKYKEAIQLLTEAIVIEDQLNYNEPPDWFFSVRHMLGDVLLKTRAYNQAEKVYREDLVNWPKNGFAMSGLVESLTGQGKVDEAGEVKRQYDEAWRYADTALKGSVVNPAQRKDLVLRIDEKSSDGLVYLASIVCVKR